MVTVAYAKTETSGDVTATWHSGSQEIHVLVGLSGHLYLTVDETHQLMDELRVALRTAAEDEGGRP
ncbi:hypothetical protein BO226_11380 [Rhodococcus sp. 2G]|nr:hypothetical protein BO226_11380 [Rhodococcus sp. 2G]